MHVLTPRTGETTAAKAEEFAVVHYGPQGNATSDAVINVVFSRAMRALEASDEETPIPVTVEPALPGKWQWIGTNGVQFQPSGGKLPLGTQIRVVVPEKTRALDGQILGKTLKFSFTTPTPYLDSHAPSDGQRSVELRPRIVLDFNQPVQVAEVQRLVSIDVAGKSQAFSVEPSKENRFERVVLALQADLPRNSAVNVKVPAGLHSIGGDVPSPHEKSFTFHTYGPLVATVRCGWNECLPDSGVTLEFSNPVRLSTVKPRVSLSPAQPLVWPDWYAENEESTAYGLSFAGRPRTKYELQLAAGLTDVHGQPLQGLTKLPFTTGDYWESLAIGAEGEILQPAAVRALPIRARNLEEYTVSLGPVDPAFVIAFADRLWDLPSDAWHPATRTRVTPGITNRFHEHTLDLLTPLAEANNGLARGAVLVSTHHQGRQDYASTENRLLQVTDLGMTAKLSKFGSLVWVTKLSTGAPVAGASVEVVQGGNVTHRYTTDGSGFVMIPKSDFVPQFMDANRQTGLVARHEGDWVAASEQSHLGAWRMPIYPMLHENREEDAFLFTERGVYRPGDKVWVKGIVRRNADSEGGTAGGLLVVSGKKFTVTMSDPSGKELSQHAVTTNAFGTFAQQLSVPSSVELGTFFVGVRDEGNNDVNSTTFMVAEYEPAEFAVNAEAKAKSYIRGATGQFSTDAAFLYGAPVANADVHYTLSYEPATYWVPNADDYDTADDAFRWSVDSESPSSGSLAEGDAKLDAQGRWSLASALAPSGQVGPLNVRFETSVTDVSRKTISGSAMTLVHPAAFYLGVKRLEDWFVAAPSTVSPKIAAFSPSGSRVSGRSVALELIHRRWTSVKEQWDGGYRQVYQRVDDVVARCTLNTGAADQSCPLALSEGGAYIVRAKSKDEAGRDVYASQEFYAIGGGRVAWRDDAQNATMDLVPNKKVYRVGDTARVLVKSPFTQGEALVTVERAGIIERRKVTLTGGTPVVEVPITDQLRPNAYVSVHLIKKREANAPPAAVGDELYRIGYAELKVDASERVLQVSVTPKAGAVRPRTPIEVDVLVRDASGKPKAAEVTFYAVDEGVLMLTGYQVPDPVGRFTGPRPLQIATLETRANLARIFEPRAMPGSEKGAEGGGGGDARSDFKQSAYFNPTLTTDEQGRARVTFQAPDNLTTFRLMAVAVSKDDRYGSGQSRVTVNKPLMARPALPRFLRAGDKFEAAVAVSTKGSTSKTVDVSLDVGVGLVLRDDKVKQLQVTKDGTGEVRFKVEAVETGETTLQFTVAGTTERDVVRLTRLIHSPAQLEAVAAYGETTGTDGQRLGKLDEVRSDVGGLDVTLASSRLVGLDGSMDQLVEYPYFCTEQLASRLLPVLPLSELAAEFGFEVMPDVKGFAGRTVRTILERQHANGGFGFWPESESTHPYLTAYTLWVLELAKRKGVSINADVFERGVSYLKPIVNNTSKDVEELRHHGLSRDLQAFITFVLAELGRPDLGAIERLATDAKEVGIPGHAWLLMAAVKAKAPESLRKPLLQRLESSINIDGNRAVVENSDGWYLDDLLSSPLKIQALVLSALLTEKPSHPLAGKLVAELLQRRESGTWRTTQESAFALLAIDQYWRAQEKETPRFEARVWVGETPLIQQTFDGRSTKASVQHVGMDKLTAAGGLDVIFQRAGKDMLPATGTLFYEARLMYAPVMLPKVGLDRGFSVQKTVRSVPVAELGTAMATLGETQAEVSAKDMVIVDLLVVAPAARRFVVVDDPVPAGLSAFDASLATSSRAAADLEQGSGVRVTGFSPAWHRRELRDDRALFFIDEMPAGMYHFRYLARAHTPGDFVVPPTRVMEMYQPEVYGRTRAIQLTVVPGR
jgi:uncharacterized protein YfaS (alpha-2-macroglobulin family)